MLSAAAKVLSTIAVGAAVGAGALLLRSAEAKQASLDGIVDGTLVTLRTPVEGIAHLEAIEPGQLLEAGDVVASIDPIVDAEITAPSPVPGLSGGFSRPMVVSPSEAPARIAALEERLRRLREKANALPIAAQPAQGRAPVTVPVEAPDLTGHERAIRSARAEVDAAEAAEASARQAAEKADYLLAEGAIAAKEAERARDALADASAALAAAKGRLELAQEALAEAKAQAERPAQPPPPTPSSPANASERAAIEAEIVQVQREIERLRDLPTTVSRVARPRAVFGGIGGLRPITPFVPEEVASSEAKQLEVPYDAYVQEVLARPSARLEANAPVVRLVRASPVWVQAYFAAETAHRLRLGMAVDVWIGETKLAGRIAEIGSKPFWSSLGATRKAPSGTVSVRVELPGRQQVFAWLGRKARVVVP